MTVTETAPIEDPAAGVVARMASDIGQATAVEQARAVAEVQAAVVVARQCPRSLDFALEEMRLSCRQMGLAERAFFRYSRGGSQITGASIHLARELARCWQNLQYGLVELSRDDIKGESQMLAFAWDVQTNTRAQTTFIVKHGRDTSNGRKDLTDLRDIYENNANNGARRLREQIFALLPKWYTEEAQDICRQTVEGDESTLKDRIAACIDRYEKNVNISLAQLEAKLGRKRHEWKAQDVATLNVIARSIANGETTVDEEFGEKPVSAKEIRESKAAAAAPAQEAAAAVEQPALDGAPDPSTNCPSCGMPAPDHDTDCTAG